MKLGSRIRVATITLATFLIVGIWGCVDGDTIYSEQPAWEEAPPEALGFLGYELFNSGQTLCG
ncbi:MAG: hypothetical protein KJN92_10600, partial [Gemmatimonadetes bacterium]|nr:hypothetical protein [Gemmatimonadota bacterium]